MQIFEIELRMQKNGNEIIIFCFSLESSNYKGRHIIFGGKYIYTILCIGPSDSDDLKISKFFTMHIQKWSAGLKHGGCRRHGDLILVG